MWFLCELESSCETERKTEFHSAIPTTMRNRWMNVTISKTRYWRANDMRLRTHFDSDFPRLSTLRNDFLCD